MDASELRRRISSLERECSQIESENRAMESEISAICSSAQYATNTMVRTYNNATGSLDSSTNVIEYSEAVLHDIISEQDNISYLYRGFKNIETANKKIRELNNKIYFEFANFRMVRKIVRSFIDNINLDIVNPELIFKSVEKEHLQSPDFWLSGAMLAIMHWKNDDKDAAMRALNQAMELDSHQTILFFMSFNLLLGRQDAALKWFECYMREEKSGGDVGIVLLFLHAVNLKSPDSKDLLSNKIKEFLLKEYEESKAQNNLDEIVELVKAHLVQCNSTETFVFNTMRNYVKDYSAMTNTLSMAKDNTAVLDFVESTNNNTRNRGYIYIEKFISQLLDTPDKKERKYTDEIDYNEEIIKNIGDLGLADREFKKKHDHEIAPLNLMRECVNWLFLPNTDAISEVAKSNLFVLCRDIIQMAVDRYTNEYRSTFKYTHPVTIKDYSTEMDFKQKDVETKKLTQFYENKRTSQLAAIKNTAIITLFVFAALCLVGAIVSVSCNKLVDGPVLYIVGAIVGVVAIILALIAVSKIVSNKRKRAKVEKDSAAAMEFGLKIIESLFQEFSEYTQLYEDSDRLVQDISFAINK